MRSSRVRSREYYRVFWPFRDATLGGENVAGVMNESVMRNRFSSSVCSYSCDVKYDSSARNEEK